MTARNLFLVLLLTVSLSSASWAGTVSWNELSDRDISPQGRAALSVERERWLHSESEHFIYHFRDEKLADTFFVYAEHYYSWIKELFGVERDLWSKKWHIFVFEDKTEWEAFKKRVGQGQGAEAFTTGWELFIFRNPFWLAPQKTLAHELTHLIVFRFLDGPIPLFLNEGISEYISFKAIAQKADGDEYNVRVFKKIPAGLWINCSSLASMTEYPPREQIQVFYRESEFVVRDLIQNRPPEQFYTLLRKVAEGGDFASVLSSVYGMDMETLEKEVKKTYLQS